MSDLASSMILAVLGIVFYHLAQKLQPSDLSIFWQKSDRLLGCRYGSNRQKLVEYKAIAKTQES